jgi:DNA polymerase III delta prime subunit
MPFNVFISYKSEHRDFAERLHNVLREWGHMPWLDVHEIPFGTTSQTKGWDDAIHLGLKSSSVVIGILTADALRSKHVLDEWGWALTNERRLFILEREKVPNEDIPPDYIRIQRIDVKKDEGVGFEQLKGALESPALIIPSPILRSVPAQPTIKPTTQADSLDPLQSFIQRLQGRADKSELRATMLQKVHNFWIDGVLKNVLSENSLIELNLEFAKPSAVLFHVDYGNYRLPSSTKIGEVFENMDSKMLFLGAPGAGKTTLMLSLAQELIEKAKNDFSYPIPIIFNLSSWAKKQLPLDKWLVERLRFEYRVPKTVAIDWIENSQILPLLDGLDEVAEEYRYECAQRINQFAADFSTTKLLVCSRLTDFELLQQAMSLRGGIVLQPLSQEQIDAYVSPPFLQGLRSALKTDPILREMAETPLLLNAMTLTYRDLSDVQISGLKTLEERRDHLFAGYIEKRFRLHAQENYTLRQVQHYLSWLARLMQRNNQTIFYIEDINEEWLDKPPAKLISLLLSLLRDKSNEQFEKITFDKGIAITAIIFLLPLLAIIFGLGNYFGTTSQAALWGSVISGFVVIFLLKILTPYIRRIAAGSSCLFILMSLVIIVSGFLLGAFIGSYTLGGPDGEFALDWKILFFSLSGSVLGLRGRKIEARSLPNETTFNIASNSLVLSTMWATLFVGAGLIGQQGNISRDTIFVSAIAFIVMFYFHGRRVIHHILIRYILSNRQHTPMNYAKFLLECTNLGLLRRVGGGFIFVHRFLLEYFAKQSYHMK